MTTLTTDVRYGATGRLFPPVMPPVYQADNTQVLPAQVPAYQQVIAWLLFWPLLTLIARQAVYFAGPARTAEAIQHGAAMGGARGSHAYLYVNLFFLFAFVAAGHAQVWLVLKRNSIILCMLVLALCSTLWSASPYITFTMFIEVGLCTLFACYLSSRFTAEHLMELLTFTGVAAVVLSILFAVAIPSYGVFHGYADETSVAWQGVCNHKNTLGISMAYLLSIVCYTGSYSRGRRLLFAFLLLFLIFKSQSRGAWFDTLAMLCFVGWLSVIRRARSRNLTPLLLLTGGVIVVTLASALYFWPVIAEHIGKSSSMSGRTAIYSEVWDSIMKRPWLGYGFGGFWFPGSLESQRIALTLRWPNIGYSENGILELALQTGFVGVALLFVMLGRAVLQGIRLLRSPHYSPRVSWFLTLLMLAALTNIDAGWFMTADTLDWVLIVVACVGLNEETLRARISGRRDAVQSPQFMPVPR